MLGGSGVELGEVAIARRLVTVPGTSEVFTHRSPTIVEEHSALLVEAWRYLACPVGAQLGLDELGQACLDVIALVVFEDLALPIGLGFIVLGDLGQQMLGGRGKHSVRATDRVGELSQRRHVDGASGLLSHRHADAHTLVGGDLLDRQIHCLSQVGCRTDEAEIATAGRTALTKPGDKRRIDVVEPAMAQLPGLVDSLGDRTWLGADRCGIRASRLGDRVAQHRPEGRIGAGQLVDGDGKGRQGGLCSTIDRGQSKLCAEINKQLVTT